ncbi:MAG: AEC family transporter [Aquificae bacterium]|nr:AEC family transporter [Aquificota bacterium]
MIENLFSVVLFFSLGYISRKFGLFDEKSAKTLIDFILYISFPALVIYNVYHLELGSDVLFLVITGWLVIIFSIILSFFVGRLLKLDRKSLASFVMMSSFGNTSFLGFPYQMAFFGEEGLRYAVIFDQLASFLPVTFLSPFILAYGSGEHPKIDIKRVITFPPFIALIGAFFIKFLGVYIPDFVLGSLNSLGFTVIPLALFSVGINLKFSSVSRYKHVIGVILFIKMIFVPVALIFILNLLGVQMDIVWKSGILEISMPPMVLASILVIGAGLNREIAVGSVAIGIILSFFTVPLIISFIN